MPAQSKTVKREVILQGVRPIMFDRYQGQTGKESASPESRLYLTPGKEPKVVLPTENILSFLTATNTTSAPKRLLDMRKYQRVCQAFQSFVEIEPLDCIPFLRNGKPIVFGRFEKGKDETSGIWVDSRVARLAKGVPNEKARPVLGLPWELAMTVSLFANDEVNESILRDMFDRGGITVGLGTFRGRYGKFSVSQWR